MKQSEKMLDSRDVAVVLNCSHGKLLRDIKKYSKLILRRGLDSKEYFRVYIYTDADDQICFCYQITMKGCGFIASRLQKEKAVDFIKVCKELFKNMEKTMRTEQIENLTQKVVDIPVNEKMQWKLLEGKRLVITLETLLDMYNVYRQREDFEKVNYTIRQVEYKLGNIVMELTNMTPNVIERRF